MLFLHALLFSLFATSTLAIPVSGADSPIETPKEAIGSDRFNGLWTLATPAIVSETILFFSHGIESR